MSPRDVTSPETSAASEEEEEVGDGPSAAKKAKKRGRKSTIRLTRQQETEAVEFIKGHPCFYDKSADDWASQAQLDYKWTPLTIQLGHTYKELLQWWTSFRTRYSKIHKKKGKSGSGLITLTDREQFVWDHAAFLFDHVRHQVNRKPTKAIKKKTASQSLPPLDDDEEAAQVVVAGVDDNQGKYVFIFLLNVS